MRIINSSFQTGIVHFFLFDIHLSLSFELGLPRENGQACSGHYRGILSWEPLNKNPSINKNSSIEYKPAWYCILGIASILPNMNDWHIHSSLLQRQPVHHSLQRPADTLSTRHQPLQWFYHFHAAKQMCMLAKMKPIWHVCGTAYFGNLCSSRLDYPSSKRIPYVADNASNILRLVAMQRISYYKWYTYF